MKKVNGIWEEVDKIQDCEVIEFSEELTLEQVKKRYPDYYEKLIKK